MRASANVVSDVKEGRGVRPRAFARDNNLSPSTVYGLIARGEIKANRIGNCLIIPPDEASRLLNLVSGEAA